jgi:hypothetical protein
VLPGPALATFHRQTLCFFNMKVIMMKTAPTEVDATLTVLSMQGTVKVLKCS